MKRFLDKAKSTFEDLRNDKPQQQQQQRHAFIAQQPVLAHDATVDGPSCIQPPTLQDITRYRYHHGANLGSIFIQERWLTGSMFPGEVSPGATSELAAAEANIKSLGFEGARQKHEQHWRDFVSDADLDWLCGVAKCTTVRLPIGYFTLGPAYCPGTAFEKVAALYENAWQAVKDLVARLHRRGMGVLIDVHGLPGGANAQEHSGTNSNKAEFWSSRKNRELAMRVVCFIAHQARGLEGVAGLQIVNEAEWDAKGMYDWYDDVLREVSKVDGGVMVYVSDGWDLNRALSWTQKRNVVRGCPNPVVVDTHLYWCFDQKDAKKSPYDIVGETWERIRELDGKEGSVHDHGAVQLVVGEYSCVLAEEAWQKANGATKEQLVAKFGNAQSQRYQQRAGGSFFWTYKMDWMPGGEWGFKQMTEQGAITPPTSLTLTSEDIHSRITNAQAQRDGRKGNIWGTHCQYWDSTRPGEYEHWRFEKGWEVGWDDALSFFGFRAKQHGQQGGDKIGMLELWVLKRLRESGQGGGFVWEWEQGFRQGVKAFYEAVGV